MIDEILSKAVDLAWGMPLVVLLLGGGFYLTVRSRFIPFVTAKHAIAVIAGKFDDPDDPGEISHFRALTTALAATVGVANIAGVAVAITQGGPGAIFWMWLAGGIGMATKFFTCTLAILYRGRDSEGNTQGGPMHYIEIGLGRRWRFMSIFFSVCGLVGCLALFQSNQLAEVMSKSYSVDRWITGALTAIVVGAVVLGGIRRIGSFTSKMVPFMCGLYVVTSLVVIFMNAEAVPHALYLIVHDAFTGTAAVGGAAGITVKTVIITGVKRAAFSNEAGIGTAPMAHGAAKTKEPVREGLVAMLGPFIDTIVVCTMTALVIITSGVWQGADGVEGAKLTTQAFEQTLGPAGRHFVTLAVVLFAVSTMVGYAYYGKTCFSYLFGKSRAWMYELFYIVMLVVGAVWTAGAVINLLDTSFALMALPNMTATLLLAPKVMAAVRDYFSRYPVWPYSRNFKGRAAKPS